MSVWDDIFKSSELVYKDFEIVFEKVGIHSSFSVGRSSLQITRRNIRHGYFVLLMGAFENALCEFPGLSPGEASEISFSKRLYALAGDDASSEIEWLIELYHDRSEIAHGRRPFQSIGNPGELMEALIHLKKKLQDGKRP